MKTLKVLLQEVVSGIKAWVNSNFAQESNTVHKTGDETVNGVKTFSSANILSEVNRIDKGLWFNGQREAYIFPETAASYSGLTFASESSIQTFKFGDWKSENNVISFNYDNAYCSIEAGYFSNDNKNKVEITPRNADDSSVGSSAYQWNNVYAKNYYYNGTAWGLDQNNTWSGSNTYSGTVNIYNSDNTQTTPELSLRSSKTEVSSLGNTTGSQGIYFADKNGRTITYVGGMVQSNGCSLRFRTFTKDESNNTIESAVQIASFVDGSKWLAPSEDNVIDLGGSSYRWKSFNGVNPGTLSFPNYSDTTYIDISGSIVPPTGETKINKNLGNNQYTPPVDGWLSIRCDGAQYLQIYRNTYNCPGVTAGDGTASIKLVVTLPVRKNETYTIRIKKDGSGIENYQLYPCLGNV